MATVAAETRGAVGLAQLDRPDARNALSPELMEELAAICERWDDDPEVRCIVIAGGDKWFAAGADIKAMAKRTLPEVIKGEENVERRSHTFWQRRGSWRRSVESSSPMKRSSGNSLWMALIKSA